MHLNILKIVPVVFLIFLSYISPCRGKPNDLVERNHTENSTSEFKSAVHERAVTSTSGDPCESNPCENGGSCIFHSKFPENFACKCKEGYIGDKCENDTGRCMLAGCQAGSTCVFEDGIAVCKETIENEDKCKDINCQNNGTCIVMPDDGNARCECADGYSGTRCEIHPCEPNPCENGGLCIFNNDFPENFKCECREEYIGDKCETDQCMYMQCEDGEVCVFEEGNVVCKEMKEGEVSISSAIYLLTSNPMVGLPLQLYCSAHGPPGTNVTWMFENAQLITDERRQILYNHTLFIRKADISDSGTYKCIVQYLNSMITDSINVEVKQHPCYSNPCRNGGQCILTEDKATCICKNDFTGDFCEIEKCKRFRCKIAGKCTIMSGQAICDCAMKYEGNFCGTDECPLMNAQCNNGRHCFKKQVPCFCYETDFGEFCSIPVEYVNYLCDSNCKETGGFCVVVNNQTTKCRCPEGTDYKQDSGCTSLKNKCPESCERTGGYCAFDGNNQIKCNCPSGTQFIGMIGCYEGACRRQEDNCKNGGTCIYYGLQLKPACLCREPFAGDFCEKRIDLPEKQNIVLLSVVCVLLIVSSIVVFCLLCNRIRSMRK